MRRARYFAVILGALALAACGGDSKPARDVEHELEGIVEKKTGTRDVTVECPDEAGEGDLCDVTAPGGIRSKVTVDGDLVQP
jgi:hypothetical protein